MTLSLRTVILVLLLGSPLYFTGCHSSDPAPQEQTGSVSGQLSPANAVTSVTATPTAGGTPVTVTLSATGAYTFPNLPAGSYTLSYVTTNGYANPGPQSATVAAGSPVTLSALTLPLAMDALTRPRWRLTGQTSTTTLNGTTTVENEYANLTACFLDDFTTYRPDKTFVRDQGPTQCTAGYPQSFTAPWDFDANGSQLVLYPGTAQAMRYDIQRLTATTLELADAFQLPNGSQKRVLTMTAF